MSGPQGCDCGTPTGVHGVCCPMACDECNGHGVYWIDGVEQKCICTEPQTDAVTTRRSDGGEGE